MGSTRVDASTCPKISNHRTGWTARVTSSLGSWRTLRSSISAMDQVSSRNRRSGPGSAHALGCAAGASDVTPRASCLDVMAGVGREHVVQSSLGSELGPQSLRSADDCEPTVLHDRDPVAQLL